MKGSPQHPEPVKGRRIALDAGHGASRGRPFSGAHANGLVEDDLALEFVVRIGHLLRQAGLQTVVTRSGADLVPLASRGKKAVESHCDIFLSIHHNAGPAQAKGIEAFVAEGDRRSRLLAERLLDAIRKHGIANRGVKWDSQSQYSSLRVLRDTYRHMPAVLLEIGFLTNAGDARLLADKHWREAVAAEIVEGITARAVK